MDNIPLYQLYDSSESYRRQESLFVTLITGLTHKGRGLLTLTSLLLSLSLPAPRLLAA